MNLNSIFSDIFSGLGDFLFVLPPLLVAIIVHEVAHGYTAYLLGDNTAKDAGRLTLNPLKHIDPVGFMSMLVFRFGWAKAVPINPGNFKHRKRDTLLVSLAGPLSNFILAIILGVLVNASFVRNDILIDMLLVGIWYNIMLGVFNLLPFPPLDGSKILASLLPVKLEYYFYKYERYLYVILLILVFTNSINRILGPFIDFAMKTLVRIVSLIY